MKRKNEEKIVIEETATENEEICPEETQKKKCKMLRCKTLLPIDDKHVFCEKCRGKIANGAKTGGKVAFAGLSIAVTIVTAGKINLNKE